jgi:hypothetical protein
MSPRRPPSWLGRTIMYSTTGCKHAVPRNAYEQTMLDDLLALTRLLRLRDITEEIADEWRYRHDFAMWAGSRFIHGWGNRDNALTRWMGLTTNLDYKTREKWIHDLTSLGF